MRNLVFKPKLERKCHFERKIEKGRGRERA
jgi:hypothetical protein